MPLVEGFQPFFMESGNDLGWTESLRIPSTVPGHSKPWPWALPGMKQPVPPQAQLSSSSSPGPLPGRDTRHFPSFVVLWGGRSDSPCELPSCSFPVPALSSTWMLQAPCLAMPRRDPIMGMLAPLPAVLCLSATAGSSCSTLLTLCYLFPPLLMLFCILSWPFPLLWTSCTAWLHFTSWL